MGQFRFSSDSYNSTLIKEDVVDDGLNGFLCAPKDSADLAKKIKKVFELDHDSRTKMGELGRKKIEQEFDEAIVCQKYFREISSVC